MEQHELDPNPCKLDVASLQRLADLVSRAHARTSATGVAIALIEDRELVTCAAFGLSAPEVGTRSPIEGSFSGRCAQSGEMQICEDVTRDERVNGEACASMGIFSMVMVPVSDSGIVRGVMAAFSDRPNSFSPSQLTVLNTFAEITNELLHHRDQAASGEVPTPVASVTDPSAKCETVLHDVLSAYEIQRRERMTEAARIAATTAATTELTPSVFAPAASIAQTATPAAITTTSPLASTAASTLRSVRNATPVTTSATVSAPFVAPTAPEAKPEKLGPQIVRATGTRGGAATKMAPVPVSEPVKRDESKVEKESELLSFAADPMPKTTKKSVPLGNVKAERSSPGQDNALFATYGTEHKSGGSSPVKFVLGGAAVLVLAGAVFGFSHMGKKTDTVLAAPVQETSAPAVAPTTATTAPVETAPASVATPPAVTKSSVGEAHVADNTQKKENAARAHAEEAPAEPLSIKQPRALAKKKSQDADVQAPTLMAGLTAGKMPELSATVVPPKADFPTASVTAPKLLNGPRPVFPQAANVLHLTGDTVVLNAKVLTNGKVGDISVVRGKPVFVQAVKDAVKRWQYAPAQLNNQPTDATIEIVFKFGPGQ